tara:strand:+ start:387 stop:689 length:303 start_codon:yes stop_codon:yes gene_type:complete
MNIEESKKLVIRSIEEALEEQEKEITEEITEDMQLIGGESLLDSMNLVQVCINLEDYADENGFEFDWASEAAMSKSKSMFRSVASLAQEFLIQSESESES